MSQPSDHDGKLPKTSPPPISGPRHSLLGIYVIAGAISGAIAGVCVMITWEPSEAIASSIRARLEPEDFFRERFEPHGDLRHMLFDADFYGRAIQRSELIIIGTYLGAGAGVALMFIRFFWPAAKYGSRAALLCASLAASIRMVLLGTHPDCPTYTDKMMAILIAAGTGAIYGFLASNLVAITFRVLARLRDNSNVQE